MKTAESWVNSYFASNPLLRSEINLVPLKKNAQFKTVLIYPNSYHIAMSNLGFQAIYYCLNQRLDTVCERYFYSPTDNTLQSLEYRHSLKSFDIIAFSLCYELDYYNAHRLLKRLGLNKNREDRPHMPLVIIGGMVNAINFMPLSKFADAVFVGEAEESLLQFMDVLSRYKNLGSKDKKESFLNEIGAIEGIFVPGINHANSVKPQHIRDLNKFCTASKILSSKTEFANMFLIEISRGCPHRCNFCVTGCVFGKFRSRSLEAILKNVDFGMQYTNKIGLIGASISDYPDIDALAFELEKRKAVVSVSSLRMETVRPELLSLLSSSGQRTVTFAPEAGAESLRYSLNKKISNQAILDKIRMAKVCGIKIVKLYFMIGLPGEKDKDVEKIILFSAQAARILPIKLNIGIFIPKPKTPFENELLAEKEVIMARIKFLRHNLSGKKNIAFRISGYSEARKEFELSFADENFFDTSGGQASP
ncbi:MAG: B12-binding domain-containing radical SAM protein [Candidatus Omnitrophica bacterium]|nr:B12-binding domain-containing radical SAM protein [Candidatus Omnitrophota bacterium]MBU1924664.1 B12-binding domain-containing radical SAM protein [Candidatus Omnitrophota bacterium]